ncbi:MAG: hypothetical protein KGD57_08800 [Candidatus Lokiarchaeota archaeon]|nr:hypothetical protein [Candidatus Lokiarchaeota archaeon]
MSIHGNQHILPLFLNKKTNQPILEDNDELTLAFYLLSKDLGNHHKILSFTRLLWPFLSIQGLVSAHIILDGLKFFSKKGKITNAPRQPMIGHILRNIDNRTKDELLTIIKDIFTYNDKDAKELGEGEESEYQILKIEALSTPEFLKSLIKLIPYLDYKPIRGYVPLDTSLTTDAALDLAEYFRNIIKILKGNAYRWETQIDLIGNEIEKWLLDLNVQQKDINLRYDSQIKKSSVSIDKEQIKKKLELEQDKIEQWTLSEKKKLVDNISAQFMNLERVLEEIVKRNRFYCSSNVLKRKSFTELKPSIEHHFEFLDKENIKFKDSLSKIKENINEIIQQELKINNEAKERFISYEKKLNNELLERDNEISNFEREKQEKVEEIKKIKNQIETEFSDIRKIIQSKIKNCLNEIKDLREWSIEDDEASLFAKPIQWIYMPIYIIFIEDKSMMEEHMKLVVPGYITEESSNIYEEVSDAFIDLKTQINEKIEDDMVLRSNFEFSASSMNILKDPNLYKKIQEGLSILRQKNIINEEIERSVRDTINNKISE